MVSGIKERGELDEEEEEEEVELEEEEDGWKVCTVDMFRSTFCCNKGIISSRSVSTTSAPSTAAAMPARPHPLVINQVHFFNVSF